MGLLDAANRGVVGGLLGMPVDMAAGLVNAGLMGGSVLGHEAGLLRADQLPQPIEKPVGGSEWIGQKMQDAGIVSAERQPLAEFLASVAVPSAAGKLSGAVGLMGAMSPEGKAGLLKALREGVLAGRIRLGDLTTGQQRTLDALTGRPSTSSDVFLTPRTLDHIVDRRMNLDGYTPDEITNFAEQAMAKRSAVEIDPASRNRNPSLLARGQRDSVTGKRYDARMPLRNENGEIEAASVVPDGLRPRKQKAPGQ